VNKDLQYSPSSRPTPPLRYGQVEARGQRCLWYRRLVNNRQEVAYLGDRFAISDVVAGVASVPAHNHAGFFSIGDRGAARCHTSSGTVALVSDGRAEVPPFATDWACCRTIVVYAAPVSTSRAINPVAAALLRLINGRDRPIRSRSSCRIGRRSVPSSSCCTLLPCHPIHLHLCCRLTVDVRDCRLTVCWYRSATKTVSSRWRQLPERVAR